MNAALPLQATATYASQGISKGAAYLTPAEATTSPVAISPGLKKRWVRSTAGGKGGICIRGQHSAGKLRQCHPRLHHSPCLPARPPARSRFKQSARLAERAAQLVNSAVSGLAWAGAKVAGGGACKAVPSSLGSDAGIPDSVAVWLKHRPGVPSLLPASSSPMCAHPMPPGSAVAGGGRQASAAGGGSE